MHDFLKEHSRRKALALSFLCLSVAFCLLLPSRAGAFTLNVEGCSASNVCASLPDGFRYLVEEDNTTLAIPQTVQVNPPSATLAIHKSHAPVATSGASASFSTTVNLPTDKRYYVTVLPNSGYALSGAPVAVGQNVVTVRVNQHPLPTAQISIFTHTDHNPINNTWDEYDGGLSGEAIPNPPPINGGLGRVSIAIYDAAGQVMYDAFGYPLGSTYDAGGNMITMGTGVILTMTAADVNDPVKNPYNLKVGEALIKYIAPGKYGVRATPPAFDDSGNPITWIQTSTIEGTPVIDAWVKANEPKMFIEGFGQGFNHVAFGFVKVGPEGDSVVSGQSVKLLPWNITNPADPDYIDRSAFTGSIEGTVRLNHFSRPPSLQGYFAGPPVAECWVGLNNPVATPGLQPSGLYAAPCDGNGHFVINNVPPGTYQLVTWDRPLDYLFGFNTVTVPAGAGSGDAVNLGDVLAFRWFGTIEGSVFYDANQNGIRDAGEAPIAQQNINIRFRDGSMYQTQPTDINGEYEFGEVFPFFNWLVAEVDFARFKATGMTTAIDYGGQITSQNWPANGNKVLQPQDPADPANVYGTTGYRTETGPVLLEAMQLFLGQTNLVDWGKAAYGPGENGGITGIVFYSVTRAENDPRYGAAETWEPGIPRVQVCLYQDNLNNTTGLPGADGIIDDINGGGIQLCDVDNAPFGWSDGSAPKGPEDVVRSGDGTTFSPGDALQVAATDSWDDNNPSRCIQDLPVVHGITAPECADGFGTWNQMRPGVFDGGYAFGSPAGAPDLAPGTYIVEAVMPAHYGIVKEEDKNVDFGEPWTPSTLLLPPVCVGTVDNGQPLHVVPNELALFPGVAIDPPLAGSTTPLCNMKQVTVKQSQNTAADFQFVTEVPKAARVVGFVLNDLSAEFNAGSPVFGEKLAAKWIPVSFRDWTGKEVNRVYADEFGTYNALLPSTWSINVPCPTGVSPSMITLVLNDPTFPDGTPDPYYDPTYTVAPWTLQYMPGTTTYADTPIVPIRAFAAGGTGFSTAPASGTPVIRSVAGPGGGPLLCSDLLQDTITITSLGPTVVIDPVTGTNVTRDYGFGVLQGIVRLNGAALAIVSWNNSTIVATVPGGATTGTIMVTRGDDNLTTEVGVTLTITNCSITTIRSVPTGSYPTIQAAINAASAGDLVLVAPGNYNENVIMHKPVHLQGAGTGSTFINANPVPLDRLQAWHAFVDALGARNFANFLLKDPFTAAEAPGIVVIGELEYPLGNLQNPDPVLTQFLNPGNPFNTPGQASIDGFTISGSKAGGGIFAVAGVSNLVISNNNITSNQGNLAGGIGIGTPDVGFDSQNDNMIIRNNKVHTNGGVDGSGGIAMNEGSQSYLVANNLVAGNFSRFNGGGIAHNGFSPGNNVIRNNKILFNEVFFGALLNLAGDGGGIFVGDSVAGVEGTGNVSIEGNLIQGNLTGAGSGAGIRAFAVNAADVAAAPDNDASWYRLNIVNNIIVNNVAAVAGAGISLQDVLRATIVNNTIVNNDSTATASLAFAAGAVNSTPQPAGIVSAIHSAALQALITLPGEPAYSNPVLRNNVVWHNRSFYDDAALNGGAGGLVPNPAGPYWDLAVINAVGTPPSLDPDDSILTALTGPNGENYNDGTNIAANPAFVNSYINNLQMSSVIDEGGNSINILFTPLDPAAGNYHITAVSPAVNQGSAVSAPATDYDGEVRPSGAGFDIGADEMNAGTVPPSPVFGIGVFTGGTWYLDSNRNGAYDAGIDATATFTAGTAAPLAVAGNWTGSGPAKIGVFENGSWYLDINGNNAWDGVPTDRISSFGAGLAGAIPVAGDWTGLGTAKIGVYAGGTWYLDLSGNGAWDGTPTDGMYAFGSGLAGAVPVTGDWTGSGTTKVGVFVDGTWYLDLNGNGAWDGTPADALYTFGSGLAGAIPVAGDWSGTGIDRIGVFADGVWYLDLSGNGAWDGTPTDMFATFGVGLPGAAPVTGNW